MKITDKKQPTKIRAKQIKSKSESMIKTSKNKIENRKLKNLKLRTRFAFVLKSSVFLITMIIIIFSFPIGQT